MKQEKRGFILREILDAVDLAMQRKGHEVQHPKYKARIKPDDHYSTGLCYRASEAVRHLADAYNVTGLAPHVARSGDMTHWWLVDTHTGHIIDPTKEQFQDAHLRQAFYNAGRGCGFLTKQPSKGARVLMEEAQRALPPPAPWRRVA